ncbi:DHA2 family efflux MFS transporter permease subunit [Tumebacillus sp. ITR2]|uniref:DHA2 family efflux MFS transporter permease subunit n=1 Tax=Tumebacillus amylolyticus TaxID=2801339 RepID=A0ABS1JA43_9BACL|nr:DHA2 family efflux MFS transporter permease subunit [Tumebacillus amylolyticus]MBL0387116.1 DHA2 family efflux MFS transporter permease subunit [Tumebacillus amylolyticus]
MSAFLIGYGAFAVFVLLAANLLVRRKSANAQVSKMDEPEAESQSLQASQSVQDPPVEKASTSTGTIDRASLPIGKILAVLLLGGFVSILNQSLLNIALPHMMNDLGVSATTIQWLITGYMLMNGVTIPLTSYLIRRYGTRNLFIAAISLFTLGALICAVSPGFTIMLIGRFVQAAGAGCIMPLMMTVFLTVFPPERRGVAMGVMGIVMIFAPAIGPTLAGWLVQNYSWRLLFILVIPIGLIDLFLAIAWLRDVTERAKDKFDAPGFVFSTLGFGGLLYGFSKAGSAGWSSWEVTLPITVGIISLILFVWRELTAEQPMLDLRPFRYGVFTLTVTVSSLMYMSMMAAMVLLPLYLQNIRGFSPVESGLLLLPGAVLMGVFSPIAGGLLNRIGARPLVVAGLLISVITTWQFTHLSADTSYSHVLFVNCIRMIGLALMMMTCTTEGLNQLPARYNSHGTAISNTMQQVAGSLGTALLVTVMSNRSLFHTAAYSNELTSTNPILVQQFTQMGKTMSSVVYGLVVKNSTIQGINDAFVVGTGMTAVALVFAVFIRRRSIPKSTIPEVASPPVERYHEA